MKCRILVENTIGMLIGYRVENDPVVYPQGAICEVVRQDDDGTALITAPNGEDWFLADYEIELLPEAE